MVKKKNKKLTSLVRNTMVYFELHKQSRYRDRLITAIYQMSSHLAFLVVHCYILLLISVVGRGEAWDFIILARSPTTTLKKLNQHMDKLYSYQLINNFDLQLRQFKEGLQIFMLTIRAGKKKKRLAERESRQECRTNDNSPVLKPVFGNDKCKSALYHSSGFRAAVLNHCFFARQWHFRWLQ